MYVHIHFGEYDGVLLINILKIRRYITIIFINIHSSDNRCSQGRLRRLCRGGGAVN